MKRVVMLVLSMLVCITFCGAQEAAKKKPAAKKAPAKAPARNVTKELDDMKAAMAEQQKQIQQLKQQVDERNAALQKTQQQLDQMQSAAQAAQAKADSAAAASAKNTEQVTTLQTEVADVKTTTATTAAQVQKAEKSVADLQEPAQIHFKGVTLTPGGFLAGETVFRNRATGGDINTSFSAVPMPGSSNAQMSEFYGSGRQSRLSLLAEGNIGSAKIGGYYEGDFLGAGTTSNNNESNSYVFRQRQAFAQAALNDGWTFTGGQMWSLVTETRKGEDNRTEATPLTIDPQYQVGFSWARQYGFRVTKNLNNKFWVGLSVENSQETLTVHGNQTNPNFLLGSAGTSGGLYNSLANYSFNAIPDFIVKAAWEPGFGHYELFAVFMDNRDRTFPCANASKTEPCSIDNSTTPTAIGATNNSSAGGGIGFNAHMPVNKHFDVGIHGLAGDGTGRYGTGGLSDVTVKPNGTLAPIRNYQALASLEFHATPKFDIYAYFGEEIDERTWYLNPANSNKPIGYGSPLFNNYGCYTETIPGTTTPAGTTAGAGYIPGSLSNCTGDTRGLIEGTLGFWYRFYNGPKGRFQVGGQYSYVNRNTWSGVGVGTVNGNTITTNGQPTPIDNMVFTSIRYYLP
ncbi:MAG: hypothetical protein ABSD20_06170 [Terriglobales bacterium]